MKPKPRKLAYRKGVKEKKCGVDGQHGMASTPTETIVKLTDRGAYSTMKNLVNLLSVVTMTEAERFSMHDSTGEYDRHQSNDRQTG